MLSIVSRNSLGNQRTVEDLSIDRQTDRNRCWSATLDPGNGDPRSPGAECLPGRPPRLIPVPAEQHLLERLAEHLVEDRVEYRIDHRAGVAEPGGQVEDLVIDLPLAVGAHGWYQIQDEERRPEDDEREENNAEHLRRFLLEPDDPAVARAVTRDHAARSRVVATHRATRGVPVRTRRGRVAALLRADARRAVVGTHRCRAADRGPSRRQQRGSRVP